MINFWKKEILIEKNYNRITVSEILFACFIELWLFFQLKFYYKKTHIPCDTVKKN